MDWKSLVLEQGALEELPQQPLDHRPHRAVAPGEALGPDPQQLLEMLRDLAKQRRLPRPAGPLDASAESARGPPAPAVAMEGGGGRTVGTWPVGPEEGSARLHAVTENDALPVRGGNRKPPEFQKEETMKRANFSNSPKRRAPLALVCVGALTALACSADVNFSPVAPSWPSGEMRLSMVSGNNQSGTAGQPLDAPFVVRVVDEHGGPFSGAVVLWDIVEGGGDLSPAKGPGKVSHETKTDPSGIASIVLTLGPQPGRNVVEARLLFGAGRATFVANGTANR